MIVDDDRDDGQQAMYYQQMEQENLDALDRCYQVGGKFDDLYFLAAQLGVGERFRKAHAPGA